MADKEIHDFEVLPPEDGEREKAQTFPQWVALLLDDIFTIPGTKVRFGLDPILGLIPGWGESSASLLSVAVLLRAAAAGVPKIVLVRMALNIVINAGAGIVPLIGDAFSVWFKSNRRNQILLEKHSGRSKASTRADWVFVMALLSVLLILLAGICLAALLVFGMLLSFLFQGVQLQ